MASSRVIVVRFNKELAASFDKLRDEFQGLPPSTIIRMIVGSTLALPLETQIEVVNAQIRKPGSTSTAAQRAYRMCLDTRSKPPDASERVRRI